MRLQLTVGRQGMVPVQLLWDPLAIRPNLPEYAGNITVAQFLEQINEVVPLEATDWGLEDYVLEVNGFECLHFCSLSILKEDDRVLVRPLQTSDLRYRRVSGRHQISWDGKHLIDGVAFGRPFLRRHDRPPVKIPPRKRIRLTYDDDEENGNLSKPCNSLQTLVRSNSNDADNEESDDDADDTDYELTEGDFMDIASELEDLNQESQDFDKGLRNAERTILSNSTGQDMNIVPKSRERRREKGLGIYRTESLDVPEKHEAYYVGEYHNPLLDQYYKEEPILQHQKPAGQNASFKLRGRGSIMQGKSSKSTPASRRSSTASLKSVRFEGEELETPATIRELFGSEAEDDEDFDPEGSVTTDSTESNKENVQPGKKSKRPKIVDEERDDSSTDLDTSSASSVTDSKSSYTSSSWDSLSNNSSGSEETRSDHERATDNKSPKSPSIHPRSAAKQISVQSKEEQKTLISVQPGRGQSKTRKRNERRRVTKKIKYMQSIGVLSSTATAEDYKSWVEARDTAQDDDGLLSAVAYSQTASAAEAFETKRNALLESILSGGIDVGRNSIDKKDSPEQKLIEQSSPPKSQVFHAKPVASLSGTQRNVPIDTDSHSNVKGITTTETQPPAISSLQAGGALKKVFSTPNMLSPGILSTVSEPSRRRAKLDLSSSRRLLFGSLGLRAPKNKDDETKLREKLMENIRPFSKVKANEQMDESSASTGGVEDMDESWKDNINLKAVECCYDGVKLSTPPFPFVQRWDPQQKRGPTGTDASRGKKRKRNQKHFYHEDDVEDQSYEFVGAKTDLDFPVGGGESARKETSTMDGSVQHLVNDELQNAVDEQLMRDTNRQTTDTTQFDLNGPLLPTDISSLNHLTTETALPGATVAFQKLEMSQETNWQPRVSEYRTGIITNLLTDNILEISLAPLSRPTREKLYDNKTGERLYSKFEMPDYENDELDEYGGVIEMNFADMIEPRLVKAAETQMELQKDLLLTGSDIETVDMSAMPDVDGGLQDQFEIERNPTFHTSSLKGNTHSPDMPLSGTSEELPYHVREKLQAAEVHGMTEESRQEISLIIKDAGFRSNVHSDLAGGIQNHMEEVNSGVPLATKTLGVASGAPEIQSPKFNGFSSSPPGEESSKQAPSDHDESAPNVTNDTTLSSILGIEDSQTQEAQERTELAIDDSVSDWNPPEINDDSIAYPALPDQLDGPSLANYHIEKSSSPASTRSTQRTRSLIRSRASTSQRKNLLSSRHGTDSDDELPTVETVLSTAPSRLERPYRTKDDSDREYSAALEKAPKSISNTQIWTREQPKRQVPSFSVADIVITSSASSVAGDDFEDTAPVLSGKSSTQPPLGSQVVDLTFSSDPVDPEESEYEERNGFKGMPKGPGWVKKTRSAGKKGEGKKLGGRKTRSM